MIDIRSNLAILKKNCAKLATVIVIWSNVAYGISIFSKTAHVIVICSSLTTMKKICSKLANMIYIYAQA